MGQTAEPEEKKEDMEKAGSASQKEDAGTDAVMKADSEEEDFVDVDDYDDEDFEEEEDEGDEDDEDDEVYEDEDFEEEEADPEDEEDDSEDEDFEDADDFDDEDFEEEDDEYDEDEEEEAGSLKSWLLFLLVSMTVAVVFSGLYFGCTVKKVHVSGNGLYTSEEIAEKVISDDSQLRHNTAFLTALYMSPFAPSIPFEKSVKVTPVSYDEIKITVEDMDIAGFIPYTGRNLYFSADGTILEISPLIVKNATFVTGISVTSAEKGSKMTADSEEGLRMILEVLQLLRKYQMRVDSVVLTRSGNMILYFDKIKVQMGKSDFELKISKIAQILPYLEGRSGTINLTNYTSADENIILK